MDIFTESDEALCILLLENNVEDYAKIHDMKKICNIKHARPKYTKVDSINKNLKVTFWCMQIRIAEMVPKVKKWRLS